MNIEPLPTVGIAEFLKSKRFRVPDFQRAFSWKNDEIEELFKDYKAAIDQPNHYFMGMIVFLQERKDSRCVVVDGQQRLATTCMIYAAIRDYFQNIPDEQEA